MTTSLSPQIADIRQALFDGRLTEAAQMVDMMRTVDPDLIQLSENCIHNQFNLFSFQCLSTSREYIHEQLQARHILVLSWLKVSDQLKLFNLAIEQRDVDVKIVDCIKFDQLSAITHKTLTNVIGYWLAHQKIDVVKHAMNVSGVSIKDHCSYPVMVYAHDNSRGSCTIEIEDVPLYWNMGFNYTPELFDFVRSEGVTMEEISAMLPYIQASENRNLAQEMYTYKTTRFEEFKSKVERINIANELHSAPSEFKKKKM